MELLFIVLLIAAGIFLLYLAAVMPRMSHRPDRRPFMGTCYAHRGLFDNTGDAPENSMAAFKKAADLGFGIELDVQMSKDRIPVIFHDDTLERMCGVKGMIADYNYEELKRFRLLDSQERIPGLEQILLMVDGRVPLIIEYKIQWTDYEICAQADKYLKEYQGAYCIESFNPLALLWYKKYRPHIMRGQLSDVFGREPGYSGFLYFVIQNLLLNFLTRPDFIAYNHIHSHVLSRVICAKLYRCLSVGWTVKSEEEMEQAADKFDLLIFDSFIPQCKNGN